MHKAYTEELATRIGNLIETSYVGEGILLISRSFLRLQVAINIKDTLVPGFTLEMEGLHALWIGLKYERLSNLCFQSGRIGHEEDNY